MNMGWGVELWDCVEEVIGHVTSDMEDVCGVFGKFIKERGEVEKEYAKSLRKLCSKYSVSGEKRERGQNVELSKERGWRSLLTELGYQAGQHELLAEVFTKTVPQDLKSKVKEDTKLVERYRKEIKSLQHSNDQAQKSLEKSNMKSQKSKQDWHLAQDALQKAESDCSVSRREVEKLRSISGEKQKQCEESMNLHARQMGCVKENNEEYLQTSLPAALDSLQGVNVLSGEYMRGVWLRCVRAEQEAYKVIQGCHREIERVVEDIRPEEDADMVIEKFKTGNVPFTEFTGDGLTTITNSKSNTIKRSKSNSKSSNGEESQNLYQQKKNLQGKVKDVEVEIEKGQKEMSSLQLMVQSYTSNPQFGDATKFKGELTRSTHKVQLLESDLYAVNKELSTVNSRLDGMKRSSSFCSQKIVTPSDRVLAIGDTVDGRKRDRSPDGSIVSSTQSDSSGYPGTASIGSASEKDNDSIEEPGDYKQRIKTLMSKSECLYLPSTSANRHSCLVRYIEEDEDEEYLPPPPAEFLEDPHTSNSEKEIICQEKAVALYAFDVCTEGNIPMVEGELFFVVLEDQGGWTRVKRFDGRFFEDEGVGFVPTSFIRKL